MKTVDIVEIYASDDIHHWLGAIYKYMFIGNELILSGDKAKGINDMIIGAKAALIAGDEHVDINTYKVANAALYYEYKDCPEKILEHVKEDSTKESEEKSSGYGNF